MDRCTLLEIEKFVNTWAVPEFKEKKPYTFSVLDDPIYTDVETVHLQRFSTLTMYLVADPFNMRVNITEKPEVMYKVYRRANKYGLKITEWLVPNKYSSLFKENYENTHSINGKYGLSLHILDGSMKLFGIPVKFTAY